MIDDSRFNLPSLLYSAEQTRALDSYAIQNLGIPGLRLMEKAGQACFDVLQKRWPNSNALAIFCGSGNNAGDGYVIADLAQAAGKTVMLFQMGSTDKLKGDALTCAQGVKALPVLDIAQTENSEKIQQHLNQCDVIVDALLGTGLKGDVSAPYANAINAINQYQTTKNY